MRNPTRRALVGEILPDLIDGFGPDAASVPETVDQAPVPGKQDASAVAGKPGLTHKCFDFGKECIVHDDTIARNRVQVNARYNVNAEHAAACYSRPMSDEIFDRLRAAIEEDGRSYSRLSVDAGLGRNFVQQLLKNRKDPGFDKLSKIVRALGPELGHFVLTGNRLSDWDLAFLEIVASIDQESRKNLLKIAEGLANRQHTPATENGETAAG